MGRESTDAMSQLVLEICSLSTHSNGCTHRLRCGTVKSHFIDWYGVLGVEENVDQEVIRRRYHKLALQLHPDKNKHPKAEIAFKLVLEAYSYLSDDAKRHAFNVERWRNICIECNNIIASTPSATKPNKWNPPNHSKSYQIPCELRDNRSRFKEETEVVENCLRVYAASRKESPVFNPSDYTFRCNTRLPDYSIKRSTRAPDNLFHSNTRQRPQRESPIFNPSDYLFKGQPHARETFNRKPDGLTYSQRENVLHYGKGIGRSDSSRHNPE